MLRDEFEKTSAMKIPKSKINIGKTFQTGAKKAKEGLTSGAKTLGKGVMTGAEAVAEAGSTAGAVSLLGLTALTNSIIDATVNARNKKK